MNKVLGIALTLGLATMLSAAPQSPQSGTPETKPVPTVTKHSTTKHTTTKHATTKHAAKHNSKKHSARQNTHTTASAKPQSPTVTPVK